MLVSHCPICSPHKRSNCTPDLSSFSSTPVAVSNSSPSCVSHNKRKKFNPSITPSSAKYFTSSAVSNQPTTTGFFNLNPTPVPVSNPSCLSPNNRKPSATCSSSLTAPSLASYSSTPVAVSNPPGCLRSLSNNRKPYTCLFFKFNLSIASLAKYFTSSAVSNQPTTTGFFNLNPTPVPISNPSCLSPNNRKPSATCSSSLTASSLDSHSSTPVAVSNPFPGCLSPHHCKPYAVLQVYLSAVSDPSPPCSRCLRAAHSNDPS